MLAGATKLYERALYSGAPPPPPLSLAWSALPSPPPPLLFLANGTGEVAVALSLTFVPAAVFSTPVVRGVEVLKVVQLYDAVARAPTGPALRAVPLGSVVTVTLQVTTPDELDGLLVEDWLPAGLEAIDPNVAGDSNDELRPFWMRYSCGWWWWRCTSFERTTRKDRVSFYARWARPGTHTLSYEAVAATRGEFAAAGEGGGDAPARSDGVVGRRGPARRAVAAVGRAAAGAGGARACPGDCSGRGACDAGTGRCRCDAGVGGAACDTTVVPTSLGGADAVHARSKSAVDVDVSLEGATAPP